MEALLTLAPEGFSGVEILLSVTVVLSTMTAVLLVLVATSLPSSHRFPLFVAAVALAGAAWFLGGLWISWKEAFELAGTSYCVTGRPIADEYRIIAWALGTPAILYSFSLSNGGTRRVVQGIPFLLLALAAPFSSPVALALLLWVGLVLLKNTVLRPETTLAFLSVLLGVLLADMHAWHPFSLGGGPEGELVRAEILRTATDLLSLVIPALLLLIGVLRLSKSDQQKNSTLS